MSATLSAVQRFVEYQVDPVPAPEDRTTICEPSLHPLEVKAGSAVSSLVHAHDVIEYRKLCCDCSRRELAHCRKFLHRNNFDSYLRYRRRAERDNVMPIGWIEIPQCGGDFFLGSAVEYDPGKRALGLARRNRAGCTLATCAKRAP
jgi:hypothetical protein